MNRSTPLTLLTLVMFCLVTPLGAWGAEAADAKTAGDAGCTAEEKKNYRRDISLFRQQKQGASDKVQEQLNAKIADIQSSLDSCEKDISDKKANCDTLVKEKNDILEKFDSSAQVAARVCLSANEDDESDMSSALLYQMMGQTLEGKSQCDLSGAKTSRKEERKDIDKDVKDLEKEVRKTDGEILKKQKNIQEELREISDARIKLKEEWENAQEEAQDAQVKALSKLRENQLQISDNIRKLQTAAMTARQNVQSIEIEIKAAMNTAKAPNGKVVSLRNENAIHNHCVAVAKAARKEAGGGGMSKNASSGTQQVKTLKAAYETCVTELHELRQTVYQSFENDAERRLKQQQDINQQLAETEKSYAQSTEDYNKLLEQLNTKLTKAQQRYFERDSDLANKYNELMTLGQQEQAKLAQEKMEDQRKIQGKYTSQGKMSDRDAKEILAKAERLYAVEDKLIENCPDLGTIRTKDIVDKEVQDETDSREERGNR